MSKKKKHPIPEIPFDEEEFSAASSNDCTGLMSAIPADIDEWESYCDIRDVTPEYFD